MAESLIITILSENMLRWIKIENTLSNLAMKKADGKRQISERHVGGIINTYYSLFKLSFLEVVML